MLVAEPMEPADASGLQSSRVALSIALQNETDWRKRAALAAKLISLSLEGA